MSTVPGASLLCWCARLVPWSQRDEWLAEWRAESAHAWRAGEQSAADAWLLRLRCAGAVRDALWMRRRHHTRVERANMLRHYVTFALRQLRRKPGYATVVIGTLAVCIGANTAVFSVVNSILYDSLTYRDLDRLVTIWSNDTNNQRERNEVSVGDYRDYRERARTLASVAAYFPGWNVTRTAPNLAERLDVGVVSANFLTTVGVTPALGRSFVESEDDPAGDRVVMLSHPYWMTRFGGDSATVGRDIVLDGAPYHVVGILPSDFVFPEARVDIIAPLPMLGSFLDRRQVHLVKIIARLHEGQSLESARAELLGIAAQLEQEYPAENAGFSVTVSSTRTALLGDVERPLRVLFVAVALVLLIGCSNVANLMLAQASSRRHELAVRAALGAARAHITWQMLTESAVVAVLAGAIGLAVAWAGTPFLAALLPVEMTRIADIQVSGRVLLFTLGTCAITALLCGLVPAWYSARTAVSDVLKEGARGSRSRAHRRVQQGFVVAELSTSLVLAVCAGLVVNSFARLSSVDPGFRTEGLVRMKVSLAGDTYNDARLRRQALETVMADVARQPGVLNVGATTRFPLHDGNVTTSVRVEGETAVDGGRGPGADLRTVTAGYFEAMGIRLLSGRLFTSGERTDSGATPVLIVNETVARTLLAGRNAIGRRMQLGGNPDGPWFEIVGVVSDIRDASLRDIPTPQVFVSAQQGPPRTVSLVVHHTGRASEVVGGVRGVLTKLDPTLPLYDVQEIGDVMREATRGEQFMTVVLSAFSALALMLAVVGTYAVIAFGVDERAREIGVRIALGAQRSRVRAMVMREGAILIVIALPIGLAGVLAFTGLLRASLYGVEPTDAGTTIAAFLLLAVAALAASVVPAQRAARMDPQAVMRNS